ncbi:MAG: signal peptidase II [Actinomycetota bacterium]|nr:signal peptidase II [Actinomycetota bacterium]
MAVSREASNARSIAFVGLTTIALDQLSKAWAVAALDDRSIEVLWKLRLHLTTNTGFAFSSGQGLGPLLGLVAAFVIILLWKMRARFSSRHGVISLGLVLGGACGNLTDRLFRDPGWGWGAVVDFIDFRFWPVFNLADAAIVVGVILLGATMWSEQRRTLRDA